MSGIAEVMLNLNFEISGSDLTDNTAVSHLRSLGAKVNIGHDRENIAGADVVVTNGFAGNIALKAAEGTAKLIGDFLKDAFSHSILSKIAVLFAYGSLRRFKQRIDPRRVNGGVFLGLRGVVVKSHGGADATGFASAALLAVKMARSGFASTITQTVANAAASNKDGQSSRFDGNHTAK